MSNFFELLNIEKKYGNEVVLKDINLNIPENSIVGLIGVNGAGKTTLLKCISGISKFQGEVTYIVGSNRMELDSHIAIYIPDVPEFYSYMTGNEYLKFCSKIFYKGICDEKIYSTCTAVGLTKDDCESKICTYSRGMKQRLMIAQSLMCSAKLIMFDEPTTSLDPIGKMEIVELIKKLKNKSTIIISSHEIEEIIDICDYIIVIDKGKIRYFDTKVQFLRSKKDRIEISLFKDWSEKAIFECMSLITDELNIEVVGKDIIISGNISVETQIKIQRKLLEKNMFFHEFKTNYDPKTRFREILYE